jgi:hypothetical protein
VKTTNEVLRRHEQSARARLHSTLTFASDDGTRIRADLDVVPDDDDPHAILAAYDDGTNELIRSGRASAGFKLSKSNITRFLRTGEA